MHVRDSSGAPRTIGSFNEDFRDSDEDVSAYMDLAGSLGYEHVVLAGHSFGANKVIHYLAHNDDPRAERFLFLSPADMARLREQVSEDDAQLVADMVASGRGGERVPFDLFGWPPCIASTAYQWLFDETLDNVHAEKDGDFSQIAAIRQSGAMLIGTYDTFTRGDPVEFLENINRHTRDPSANRLVFIEWTGHTYQGKHDELCRDVESILRGWDLIRSSSLLVGIQGSIEGTEIEAGRRTGAPAPSCFTGSFL